MWLIAKGNATFLYEDGKQCLSFFLSNYPSSCAYLFSDGKTLFPIWAIVPNQVQLILCIAIFAF